MRERPPANFTLYPLAWLSVFFAFGIWSQSFFDLSTQIYLFIFAFVVILAACAAKKKSIPVWLLVLFFLLGGFCFQVERRGVAPNSLKLLYENGIFTSGAPLEVTGILRGTPELAVGGFFLDLSAESVFYKGNEQTVTGRVRLFAPVYDEKVAAEYESLNLRYGSRIRVACEPKREDKFLNPGVASSREILDQNRTDATAVVESPLLVENLGETDVFVPLAWVYESRQQLILEFKNRFSVSTAGILIASLLGNRHHLDKNTAEAFREGGTFHVLVISGLHITFIGGLTVLLVRRLTRRRRWQFLLANVFLWTYAVAVGAQAPVVRAALMFTILHLAIVIFRQGTLLNALGASALLLLVWRPSELFSQSFQLTFVCVTAIVAVAFPLMEKLRAVGEWRPSAETPAPPNVSKRLKNFCEMLYWSEAGWKRELSFQVWQCALFKTPRAAKLEQWKLQTVLRYAFETVLVSIVVQAWLLPFLIVYFHRVSLVAVFLNVWVGVLIAVESLAALFAVFTAQFSEIFAAPFVLLTEIANWLLLRASAPFVESGWSSIRPPVYTGVWKAVYAIYCLPLVALAFLLHGWRPFRSTDNGKRIIDNGRNNQPASLFHLLTKDSVRIKSLISAWLVLLFVIVFHPFSAPKPDGRLHVEFLDVGQGDSIFITAPNGETLLVDGGGKPRFDKLYIRREGEEPELFEPDAPNVGETVVSEFLWEKGYSRIDYLLATHADADHIQGLSDVARNFSVKTAIVARIPLSDEDFSEFQSVLEKRSVTLAVISRGDVLNLGGVKIEVLHPARDDSPETVSDNNHSLVLRVAYGEKSFLLTGDVEKEAEALLLQSPESLRADVVKAAHHGSHTSSTAEFVRATGAKYAVVSVGNDSPYGHPHPEIVERWKNSEAEVLTTGARGTISFSTDGKDLEVQTFLDRK